MSFIDALGRCLMHCHRIFGALLPLPPLKCWTSTYITRAWHLLGKIQALSTRRPQRRKRLIDLGTPQPSTELSRALRARNPKRVQKEPERVSRPGEPQSPQRVRHGVRKESKKSPKLRFWTRFGPKLRFWTLFGLHGGLFGDSGAPRGGTPFRTLFGLFWGSGPEGPGKALCLARGFIIMDTAWEERKSSKAGCKDTW